jgi:hypothetical protein
MHARRSLPTLLALLAALALVAGCAEESDRDPLALITDAAERTAAVEAARFRMSIDLTGSGIYDGTVMEMDAMTAMDGSAFEGVMWMEGIPVDTISVDGSYFYAFPDLPDGVEWVEVTSADLEAEGLDLEAAQQQEVDQALALLTEGGDVEQTGTERLDGVDTTVYRVVTDLVEISADTGAFSEEMLREMRGLIGDEVELEVWVDDESYVRQLAYEIDLATAPAPPPGMPAEGLLGYRFRMSDFTEDYRPPAPPDPAAVIHASEYIPGG